MTYQGEEKIIDIGDLKIAAKFWGEEDGIPVLALHGWIDNAASFDFIAPLLPELKIVAVDCPGCGHSFHHPEGVLYNYIDEAFMMFRVANALGWDKFSVMGHSRGAVLANVMAIADPTRVERVVFLDMIGSQVRTVEGNIQQIRDSLKAYLKPTKKQGAIYSTIEEAATMRTRSGIISYESALALAKHGTTSVEGGITWYFDRQHLKFRAPQLPTQEQLDAYLHAIEAPTCVVMGKEGLGQSFGDFLQGRLDQVKNLDFHIIEGGHHFHMDNPKPLGKILTNFFRK